MRAAVGDEVAWIEQKDYDGHWAEVVLHTEKSGRFDSLDIVPEFAEKHVRQTDLWVKPGDEVRAFMGANDAIGTLVLCFDTEEELVSALKDVDNWMTIKVK